jgi:diacylglycerol kinase (ATP)
MDIPYRRIYVVINPASGKNEPVLNVINQVFGRHGVEWEIGVTHAYGDATRLAQKAAAAGYDLVAGYGGDGTQHEIANGLLSGGEVDNPTPMGVLPGGTGNGFARELGVSKRLDEALETLCTSARQRQIDVGLIGNQFFIQRLYAGAIEPEDQTSREMKDKYGNLAYLISGFERVKNLENIPFRITLDGQVVEEEGVKCYVVNSGQTGTGLAIDANFAVDDGYLDVFLLAKDLEAPMAAAERFFNLKAQLAGRYYWRAREISVEPAEDKAVWVDGEYYGRTPASISIRAGALRVAVP